MDWENLQENLQETMPLYNLLPYSRYPMEAPLNQFWD